MDMNDLKKVLSGGILLSVFSFEELIKKFKGSIYYNNIFPEENAQQLLYIDEMLKNILIARAKHPLNDDIGYLYLYEVYEKLGLKYTGDHNIGITTETGYNWSNLYSPKKCRCVEHGWPNQDGKYEIWYWMCSECGQIIMPQFHYCPKCGGEIISYERTS